MNKIRQQAKSYAFDNDGFGYDINTCEDIFTDGAEWMQEIMIDKACEWLKENSDKYYYLSGDENNIEMLFDRKPLIDDFKKAMEE